MVWSHPGPPTKLHCFQRSPTGDPDSKIKIVDLNILFDCGRYNIYNMNEYEYENYPLV